MFESKEQRQVGSDFLAFNLLLLEADYALLLVVFFIHQLYVSLLEVSTMKC